MIDCNRAASELVGRKKSELVSEHQRILHSPEAIEGEFSRTYKQHRKEKEGQVLETQVITKTGEIRDVTIKANIFELGDKKLLQGTFRDITERKRVEAELRREKELMEMVTANNAAALVIISKDFRILWANKFLTDFLGDIRGKICYSTLNNLTNVCPGCGVKEILETGKNKVVHEQVVPGINGKKVWLQITAIPIRDKNGNIIAISEMAIDITERKEAEEKLDEMMNEVVTINEKLGVVGKLTRHDARNKLSVMANNVYLAKQKLAANHSSLEYLGDIESAIDQMEKIFDFARTYEMLSVEELSYMNVEKSVDEAAILFSGLAGAKLVNKCQGLTVMADSLLRQLFYNLIDDTLKHGEKVSQIRVYYEEGEDQLKLVYEDDGVGIPEDEKEKIFGEGYGKGTGYGLYLIKKICEAYSWTIRETGKLGKGAKFTMTIPKTNKNGKNSYIIN